jgi:hypothetical protein
MEKKIYTLILAALFLIAQPLIACDEMGVTGIVEDNKLWIGPDAKDISSVTKESFNSILDKVEAIYTPILKDMGKKLSVIRKWDDGTVNAYAQRSGNTWKISMFGGLARHATVTGDAFALVACHEVGHHIGGAPKKRSFFSSSWASNEGQADYWGTSKCLRKFMEDDDNVSLMSKIEVPALAKEKCESSFSKSGNELAMCLRGAMAGMSLANLFRALRNLEDPLQFDTPDPRVVKKTNDSHPAPQCRLDTYFHGALCDRDAYQDADQKDPSVGFCNRRDNYTDGIRPLCWYKPKKS